MDMRIFFIKILKILTKNGGHTLKCQRMLRTAYWTETVGLHHYIPVLHDASFATTLIERQSTTNNLQASRGISWKSSGFFLGFCC